MAKTKCIDYLCKTASLVFCSNIEALAEEFWNSKHAYTPESRVETHEFTKLQKNYIPKSANENTEKE